MSKYCGPSPKSAGHVHVHSLQSMSMSIVCRPCPKFAGHLQSLQVMSMCKACSFSVQFCDLIIPSTVKILGQPLNKSHHPSFCNGKPADPMDCKLLTISCQSKTKKEIFFLIKKWPTWKLATSAHPREERRPRHMVALFIRRNHRSSSPTSDCTALNRTYIVENAAQEVVPLKMKVLAKRLES